MRNYENVCFPENCRGVIDVTKAPYYLDNTGKQDCTEVLVRMLNDLLEHNIPEMQEVYNALAALPTDGKIRSNNFKKNGVINAVNTFYIAQQPTLYFPNGTYLISDTVSYTLENLKNMMFHQTVGGHEMNRCIRFMGQNREKTVIKLKDHCKGFEFGQERPVLNFMQGERSNVSYSNYFENITIDTGVGNPGAVGLVFFANNNGAVRNVTIRSSDPNHVGAVGIVLKHEIHSACNFYNVDIDGFDYAVRITSYRTYSHFENIRLSNQRRYGFWISNNAVQIIGLNSHNDIPALCVSDSSTGHVVLVDAVLESEGTSYEAIKLDVGACLYLRNVQTSGYAFSLNQHWREVMLPVGLIDEYCYPQSYTLFDKEAKSLRLSIAAMPDLPRAPLSDWCCVNDFGATGDGKTDDTLAIQKAFSCGKPVVWFQPGRYMISKPIHIPAHVNHVHFMFCDLAAPLTLSDEIHEGVFRIVGESDQPLLIEKLQAWYECTGTAKMFRNDTTRTLVMRDLHSQGCASYFNTVPGGQVHMENVACTISNRTRNGHVPCFSFKGQQVWLHAINPERSWIEVENIGSRIWWSGFKVEGPGSICVTKDGGETEILGGVAGIGDGLDVPLILNDNCNVSAIFATQAIHYYSTYPLAVREIRGNESKEIRSHELPQRNAPWYFMPLYSGRSAE